MSRKFLCLRWCSTTWHEIFSLLFCLNFVASHKKILDIINNKTESHNEWMEESKCLGGWRKRRKLSFKAKASIHKEIMALDVAERCLIILLTLLSKWRTWIGEILREDKDREVVEVTLWGRWDQRFHNFMYFYASLEPNCVSLCLESAYLNFSLAFG